MSYDVSMRDTVAESERKSRSPSKDQIQPGCGEVSWLKRNGTAEAVLRDQQILRRRREKMIVRSPADHDEQDLQLTTTVYYTFFFSYSVSV